MAELKMIDVSQHQQDIDWKKVVSSGIKNALIRVGWCGYDGLVEGKGYSGLDKYFHQNMKSAIAAGVNVGVYVYSYARTPEAAKIAAQDVLRLVKPYRVTLPVAFDFEEDPVEIKLGSAPGYIRNSKDYNTKIVRSFLREIENAGYYAMLYANTNYAVNYLDMKALLDYDFWLASYSQSPTYSGNFGIWQYTQTGHCSGIKGYVDLNIAYMDYADIIIKNGLNNISSTPLVTPFKVYEMIKRGEYATQESAKQAANDLDTEGKKAVVVKE